MPPPSSTATTPSTTLTRNSQLPTPSRSSQVIPHCRTCKVPMKGHPKPCPAREKPQTPSRKVPHCRTCDVPMKGHPRPCPRKAQHSKEFITQSSPPISTQVAATRKCRLVASPELKDLDKQDQSNPFKLVDPTNLPDSAPPPNSKSAPQLRTNSELESHKNRAAFVSRLSDGAFASIYVVSKTEVDEVVSTAKSHNFCTHYGANDDENDSQALVILGRDENAIAALMQKIEKGREQAALNKSEITAQPSAVKTTAEAAVVGAVSMMSNAFRRLRSRPSEGK